MLQQSKFKRLKQCAFSFLRLPTSKCNVRLKSETHTTTTAWGPTLVQMITTLLQLVCVRLPRPHSQLDSQHEQKHQKGDAGFNG